MCVGRYYALSDNSGKAGRTFQESCRRPCADGHGTNQSHALPRGAESGVD